jgi:hypothetical protein
MIISDKHKLIFIKVPRTSSTSIENYFIDLLGLVHWNSQWRQSEVRSWSGDFWTDSDAKEPSWSKVLSTHSKAKDVKKALSETPEGREIWSTYFKCAFVRNPWDWAASQFCWNFGGSFPNQRVPRTGEFTADLADKVVKLLSEEAANGEKIQNQYTFLHDEEGNLLVDFVGRFEDRTAGLKHILENIGVPFESGCGEHIHRTANTDINYEDFYTHGSKRVISNMFAKDIEAFNYQFGQRHIR